MGAGAAQREGTQGGHKGGHWSGRMAGLDPSSAVFGELEQWQPGPGTEPDAALCCRHCWWQQPGLGVPWCLGKASLPGASQEQGFGDLFVVSKEFCLLTLDVFRIT